MGPVAVVLILVVVPSLSSPRCPVVVLSSLSHRCPLLVVPSLSSPRCPIVVLSSLSHRCPLIIVPSLSSRCCLVILSLVLSSASCCPHSVLGLLLSSFPVLVVSSCSFPSPFPHRCSPVAIPPSLCPPPLIVVVGGQVLGTRCLRHFSLSSRCAPLVVPPFPHPRHWPVVGPLSSSLSSAASTHVPPHEQELAAAVGGAVLFVIVPSLSSQSCWLLAPAFHLASRGSQRRLGVLCCSSLFLPCRLGPVGS